jgi:WD40 repeat protein
MVCILCARGLASAEQPIKTFADDESHNFLAFIDDGKTLLSVGYNNSWARLWNLSTGKADRSFKTHWPARACDLSPDQKTLVTYNLGRVSLYNLASGDRSSWIPHDGVPCFSPDGKTLAIVNNEDKSIILWDIALGETRTILKDTKNPTYEIAFSPNGKILASAGKASVIRLWDVNLGRQSSVLTGHSESEEVKRIAFSPDGKLLASTALRLGKRIPATEVGVPKEDASSFTATEVLGGEIKVWDAQTSKLITSFTPHKWQLAALLFSPDGKFLITGSKKSVIVWDTSTWKRVKSLELSDDILSAAISPDGQFLAVGCWDKRISVWKLKD